jgi:hypothetical protein
VLRHNGKIRKTNSLERLNRLDNILKQGQTEMKVKESTRRLAFIKYLYNMAVEQSMKPEPTCASSVLTFHDSIELFLELASEHLDIGKKEVEFMKYWELLKPKLKGDELTQKESIRQLNKARVGLKHSGLFPSKLAIEDFRASATNFFEENTPIVFDIKFPDISLIDLVQCEQAKKRLMDAQKMLNANKMKDALENAGIAFVQLVDDYENRKKDQFGRSPFFFGSSIYGPDAPDFLDDISGCFSEMKKTIEALQDAVKMLSFGFDYRRYARFRLLTPIILRVIGGKYEIQWISYGLSKTPKPDDVQFCIDFVIESAIVLQEFDFEIERAKHPTLLDLY